ncbi:MAG: deoxynucleoside kinase [Candidatus Manganitrophus sp. SB1]|nr:deoxynucleoside kinase [Candidatus Manganitrophus morganii]
MGSGKTTLAKHLADAILASPLIEESGRHPFIKEFYVAPESYAVETEIAFVLLHYHQILREKRAGLFNGTVVSDFAMDRDYIFSTLTLKDPADWELFENTYNVLKKRLPIPDILIYLRAPVDFLAKRIAQRGRDYEKIMTRSYLEAVKTALDNYFLKEYKGKIIILDAPDLDSSVNPTYVDTVIKQLHIS